MVYWMSVPYIFKKYIDEVYTAGLGEVLCKDDGRTRSDLSKKYGSGGRKLRKKYMLSTTWNAPHRLKPLKTLTSSLREKELMEYLCG